MEGHGGGLVIALRRDGGFRRPDRRALERICDERRAAAGGRALGGDRAAALRDGGARARAHALGAGDPRRDRAGPRRAAPAAGQRPCERDRSKDAVSATDGERSGARRGRGRGARGPRPRDRRAAPPDHRAAPRRARRPRSGAGAPGARAPRAGDRRPGRADRDRPATDADGERLDAELESTIYRVVQEALTNVCRHAQATQAWSQHRRQPRRGDPGAR